jgi:thioredoxin reductase (NADPH)
MSGRRSFADLDRIMLSQLALLEGQTPGVLALGDLVDNIYRLPITAAASGCSVAIDAEHYLQEGKT